MTDQRLVYFVQREDGHFYCAQSRWSYGACWTPELSRAKLLTKIGPAKSACTFMHTHYPNEQPVHIIEFDLHPSKGKVIDVAAHLQTSITRRLGREKLRAERKRAFDRERLERAQDRVIAELAKLGDA